MLATHYDIVSVETLPSTQDEAFSSLEASGRATLVVANRQPAGRGRQGRSWEEPTRGLFSSLACECAWPVGSRAVITLCTAVALADSIERVSGRRCDIKWPNDLLLDAKKVAGILVETRSDTVTVGCGVNLWWPAAPEVAGALFAHDAAPGIAMDIATGWVERLLEILAADPQEWPRNVYLNRSWTVGRRVTWDGGTGRAIDIDPSGGLVVETTHGRTTITAGEVHTRQER
jgi:BirA family biotin operon repressor/biotin-[acetyl-CoA-carboxylase] ligase